MMMLSFLQQHLKRANQWRRWSEDIIPRMMVPYLSYIQETSSLRHANVPGERHQYKGVCEAGCKTRSLKVACVLFDALEEINIITCPCLFSCAPVAPSLTVDLRVLEFVRLLFVCQSPNQTAWCNAVETFLDGMGYKLTSKNTLRHRFSNAFHWYQVLIVLGREHISTLIADAQKDSTAQPTEYLRLWCPLCFGGNDWQNGTRASPSIKDPPNPTPSFFLPIDDVKAMEDFVQRSRVPRTEPEDDRYKEGMCVPVSVLDGCGESFVAADEKQEKASLMALLCRHDRVLWIMNLTSAGEKQHYALALLDRLLLYDIGCQLEQSCRKWNLLDNSVLSCISFAVAVFHAYGHQWPCQIIYHPRKCEGFRLSDGEGCERLWSSLKQLIPPLRVSGFNQHLFVLDTQICHLDIKSLHGFGHWLHQRWIHCQTKKNEALNKLQDLDLDEDMLHAEWKAQIKTLESQEASICELEMQLHSRCILDMVESNLQLVDARSRCARTTDTLWRHRAALGMDEKANLAKMKKDIYLTVRLNTRAVKTCIRDHLRLRECKSYRATVTGECKLHVNTQHSIKCREPGILKLVSTYNGLSPPSAVPPHIIPCNGIFLLDIDDNIWQDVGLNDEILDPPAWLSDEAVRDGIRLQLEVDRCVEEEAQVMREWAVIQEWMLAEWESIQAALNNASM
ncbi:hypothetical protein K503DRAFT_794925 [Rhizopogon vinicolor AM-OR11-026]|uniref:CxC1-like cysteine cluster associated with KDZ transposases domain-containing protein n=1 Tax=Rhizopogon vinicolor AM-OR11-026 TaxID=1314800 RepID=A0A1B7MG83_9AGAM|nr:hypothetical protein K503DRAFT_794925 [Rhizopogon vinicolor AM-OR11-026]